MLKEKELLGFFLTGHPMDAYRDILQRLSCVPLSQVANMDHDAVFRAAFIVESAQVKVSAKTQKKFAILIISDGIDRMELPVWSDLYEEKSSLLNENQLLYAVLQVDKKEADARITCKWLDDLTQASEAMIEACDRVFDKAKSQAARFAQAKAGPKKEKESSATKSKPMEIEKNSSTKTKEAVVSKASKNEAKMLSLKVDAGKSRLSHILQIKEVFAQHRGSTPVQIDFHAEGDPIASLHIDTRWGVAVNDLLHEKLRSLPAVLSVDVG